ncbi:MAG: threonine synthase [Methanothrix sp.]|jgi:threonine synthase|uniref:Threonine synthase n=1 Tax=Methanothrix harundinacea TaxID=301375 RepID=A0A117LGA6_9EURY|nr:MAG: threonine synthase [Methanosaeta sp. SDB]KUK45552.1 MAG: Threonine synthase [Methanothrix harundinacea]MDD3710179.1 threonine synthase [Methanothrix sp.]MDI9398161.1 threonine synthase [Euryarchaeota archaeon]KUK96780.1 MAG: Threonine synthase [Methanothrix harundinacea]
MKKIMYSSTNGHPELLDFKGALLRGQAPDKGLYVPQEIPMISEDELARFSRMDYPEIALRVMRPYLGDLIPEEDLVAILLDAYDFPVPIEKVYDEKYVMRLDKGPTFSFKDFAARLMGRLMQYFLKQEGRSMVILTATSGDTGSAVAQAFYDLDNIEVVVLFPEKEVTGRQRKQMTTLAKNVHVMAVDGKFDDCQSMVKQAFVDPDFSDLNLSSANSINVGRLIPQSIYYFYAWSRIAAPDHKIVFSVPSGNFGNVMAGLIAMRMGLPVHRFVIATNENDEFSKFMETGDYRPIRPSVKCISNAMNVGHPSNLARVFWLYGGEMDETGRVIRAPDIEMMRREIFSVSVTDAETREAISEAYNRFDILLEPHGAVGWAGLTRYLKLVEDWSPCVSLETADPAKFPEEVVRAVGLEPPTPEAMARLDYLEEKFDLVAGDYRAFKGQLSKLFL